MTQGGILGLGIYARKQDKLRQLAREKENQGSVSISKSFLSGRNLIVLCLHGHFREVYSSGIPILKALLLSHSLL